MTAPTDREALVKFDATPDATGLGRVIVDGKYYGLPVAVVRKFAALSAQQKDPYTKGVEENDPPSLR